MALSIFTCSHPHTIVDEPELNFCVRDGNRWTLRTINTNFVEASFISLAPADPLSRPVESSLIPLPLLSRSNPLALGFERGPCFFRFMGPSQDCILKTEHSDKSKSLVSKAFEPAFVGQALGILVSVSSMRCRTYTPDLSTSSSTTCLTPFGWEILS